MFQDTIYPGHTETPAYIISYMEEKYGVNREDVTERIQTIERQKELTRKYMTSNKERHNA